MYQQRQRQAATVAIGRVLGSPRTSIGRDVLEIQLVRNQWVIELAQKVLMSTR